MYLRNFSAFLIFFSLFGCQNRIEKEDEKKDQSPLIVEKKEFYSNGKIKFLYHISKIDNKKCGVYKLFYPNGRISQFGNYISDTIYGFVSYFDSLGNLTERKKTGYNPEVGKEILQEYIRYTSNDSIDYKRSLFCEINDMNDTIFLQNKLAFINVKGHYNTFDSLEIKVYSENKNLVHETMPNEFHKQFKLCPPSNDNLRIIIRPFKSVQEKDGPHIYSTYSIREFILK